MMDMGRLIHLLLDKATPAEIKPVIKWFSENLPLIESVSVETLKQFLSLINDNRILYVDNVIREMSRMTWDESLDKMEEGIEGIKEATRVRQDEVKLMAKVIELSMDMIPILLRVL